MVKKLNSIRTSISKFFKKTGSSVSKAIASRPMTSFFVALAILFVLIALGSFLRKPKAEAAKPKAEPKKVETYSIGSAPRVTMQAQVEKSGVITISAQTAGVVSYINVSEGMNVGMGATLVSLSTSYSGGNISTLQRKSAQLSYQNTLDTYDTQKDLIQKNRDLADKSRDNASNLRDITSKSLDETRQLLSLQEDILNNSDFDTKINNATTSAEIIPLKNSKALALSSIFQLRAAVRQNEYAASNDKTPAQTADVQHDIAMKQFDLQQKALDLGKETSLLQLRIAQVSESLMYPAAPFAGKVERVFVKVGQAVNPGTPLVSFSGKSENVTVVAYVPQAIAKAISKLEKSTVMIDGKTLQMYPDYVSGEAVSGQNYVAIYSIPAEYQNMLTDKGYVSVSIPVGYPDTGKVAPYIPLDSVHQTQETAYVYVIENGKTVARNITLGVVYGQFVEVKSGLKDADIVIKDRTVIAGDSVAAMQ